MEPFTVVFGGVFGRVFGAVFGDVFATEAGPWRDDRTQRAI